DRVLLRPKSQRGLFLLLIPLHRRKMLPMLLVVAEHRSDVRPHRTRARFVVVLADEIRKHHRYVAARDVIHAEVVPARLPVPAALVLLAANVAAEMGAVQPLNLPERGAGEVEIEDDLACPSF